MKNKNVICPGYDSTCTGCAHGEEHNPTARCSRGCREGVICIDYLKYSRKEKIKELNKKYE
jgi:hypothetical protein